MANIAHGSITDSQGIHEPKGVSTAAANRLYVANGSGSGSWLPIGANAIDASSIFNTNKQFLSFTVPNLPSASTKCLVLPEACIITSFTGVLTGTISTVAPVINITHNGSSAMGTFTLTVPGAIGDRYSIASPTNNTMAANDYIQFSNVGGTTGAFDFVITIKLTLTA